jgi:predicted protein tyrosine phosphatase
MFPEVPAIITFISHHHLSTHMRLLFICNQNRHRSKTAEVLFKDRFETRSAGLYNEHPVTEKDIVWADKIIVMEDFQRDELSKRFPETCLRKQLISLSIPDQFSYGQPELKALLEKRMDLLLASMPLTAA